MNDTLNIVLKTELQKQGKKVVARLCLKHLKIPTFTTSLCTSVNPLLPELNATSTGPAARIFNWGF
jgi:hypothetical protein